MGVITQILAALFGGNRNRLTEVIEVLRPNAEAASARGAEFDTAVLAQFAAEFAQPRKGWFDRFVDALNRLPRPLLTLGAVVVLMLPVYDPILATEVFTAWAIIPAALWTLIAIIVTFFFGGRGQTQELNFNRDLAGAAVTLPQVLSQLRDIRAMALPEISSQTPLIADSGTDANTTLGAGDPDHNPALAEILARQARPSPD